MPHKPAQPKAPAPSTSQACLFRPLIRLLSPLSCREEDNYMRLMERKVKGAKSAGVCGNSKKPAERADSSNCHARHKSLSVEHADPRHSTATLR
jgi:hypothetical protein